MVQMYFPPQYKEPPEPTSSVSMRAVTSGVREKPYGTKLLSSLYFRAIHDDTIQEFQLATNVDKIGAFSDICFKAQVKGYEKSVTVFIQAEQRENKKQALKIDLATYFDSYIKIRQHFGRYPTCDWVFEGTFIETLCLFVIFTNANVDYSDASATSGLSAKLNNILDMGGTVKQPNSEDNIEYLTKKTVKDQITSLAEWIVEFIYDDQKFQLMLSEELFLRYHVILAQKVLDVSDIQHLEREDAPRYRIASFRQDFFDNTEEHIILFRDTLYLEVIKRRRIEATESDILVFLADPTDAARLSKVIAIVTYNNGKLEFDKQSTKKFRPNIKPMDVSQSTFNKAVELAAIEILSSVMFKVPAAFGNKDLTFSGSHDKIERRIRHLALKMKDLLEECKLTSKVVTIDESLGDGFLRLNGGIAGAIGNIFVLDDNTNLMKITDNCETLGTLAKSLYTILKSEVHNLHEYKFCFKVDKFPKLSFDCSHYEEKMARDFLNKILVYCNQAEENELQEILKNEIEDIQRNQPNYFQAKTDAILLRYYDEIQKWWMRPQHASYLSPRIDLLRQLIDDIIKDPLMSSINITYTSKIKQYDYTYTEDAVRSLNLQDQRSSTIIVAENCLLTVVKVLQHLKNKDHVVLDLEYIASLPTNDLNALRAELVNTNNEKVLVLVCNKIDSKNEMKTLKNIAEAVKNKTKNIITDQKSLEILIEHKYFPEAGKILHDKKFSLIDVCKESQKSIVEHATVVFPGVEIRLDHLVKDWAKTGLTSAGEADVAGVAAVTDKPTATGSRDFGMEPRDVVERKMRFLTVSELARSPPRDSEKFPIFERAHKRRSALEAEAAGREAAVTDKPTATGSHDFGLKNLGVVERKKGREAGSLTVYERDQLRSAGEADVAGVAAVTDKPTATGSRDFGMKNLGVVKRKGREAESLTVYDRDQLRVNPFLIPGKGANYDYPASYYDMSGEKYLIILSQPTSKKNTISMNQKSSDIDSLQRVFEKLGFTVFVFENMTYNEIVETLTEIATRDHSKTSCIGVVILTHSSKGGAVFAADRPYPVNDIMAIFAKQRSLDEKPKLFFVQACRDANMDAGTTVILDSHICGIRADSTQTTRDSTITLSYADSLVLCSTGNKEPLSYRNSNKSLMIHALCTEILVHHDDLDLLEIITLVNRFMAKEISTFNEKIQMPETRSTLTKRLKF